MSVITQMLIGYLIIVVVLGIYSWRTNPIFKYTVEVIKNMIKELRK